MRFIPVHFVAAGMAIASILVSGCSGGGGSSAAAASPPVPPGRLELFAGAPSGSGNVDGIGPAASLYNPTGLATDAGGNIYVADTGNSTIRRITPAREVTTFAGSAGMPGHVDAAGSAARLAAPQGIAVDPAGNVYVADVGNRAIRKITATGSVSTLATIPLPNLHSIAADGSGTVYLADPINFVIWRSVAGAPFTMFAGAAGQSGSADGIGSAARFARPLSVAVDAAGMLYVADQENHTVRRITPAGVVSTFSGIAGTEGHRNGTLAEATFSYPAYLGVDTIGNVYVLGVGPYPHSTELRRVTPSGMVTTYPNDSATVPVSFAGGIAAEPRGNSVYYTDSFQNLVGQIGPSIQSNAFAGSPTSLGSYDGLGDQARFRFTGSMVFDGQGALYVADADHVRRITPAGQVTTFVALEADSLAMGTTGNLYAGSEFCFTPPRGPAPPCVGTIRVITPAGAASVVTPSSSSDGSGIVIESPRGLAIDAAGNLYIADSARATIRKLTPAGDITILAGEPHAIGFADGVGRAARFTRPIDMAIDRFRNLLVIDGHAIRRVDPSGEVLTLAGSVSEPGHVDGAGAAARFYVPSGLTVDDEGNADVADTMNSVIRKITPSGVVTTVAGRPGVLGFQPGPLPAVLNRPYRVAIRGRDLYVAMGALVAVVRNTP